MAFPDLEHPEINNTLNTGYPSDREPEPPMCLICGGPCEKLYREKDTGDILGCDLCIEEIEPLEDGWA